MAQRLLHLSSFQVGAEVKVLVAGGAAGVACAGHSPLQLAPTDPPLAKAEPISNAGGASVVTYLRKGKNQCAAAVREE